MHQTLKVKLTFTEPLLATCPGNRELVEKYIASKAPTIAAAQEELEAAQVPAEIENASTVFARADGRCILWDYQLRGFLKEAAKNLVELGQAPAGLNPWNTARAITNFLFVHPRQLVIRGPVGQDLWTPATLERPLRAETLQGPRVCLARSEVAPAGSSIEAEIRWLASTNKKSKVAVFTREVIENLLDFGQYVGQGQWRGSGGYGRFTWNAVEQLKATA